MTWSRTQTRFLAASPESVWDVLATPSLWASFDADVQSFTPVDRPALTGPHGPEQLELGDRVRVLPHARLRGALHALTAPPARISSLVTDQELAWTQDQPGGSTTQTWLLTPSGTGTLLTRSITVTGSLAGALGPTMGGALSHDLGSVAARLVQLAGTSDPEAARAPQVIIAGGSGLLGSRLAHDLVARGRDVVVLTRSPHPGMAYRQASWDGVSQGSWAALFDDARGVDVVNLSGHRIGDTGGAATMAKLTTSRVNPTRALVEAARAASRRAGHPVVKHWVQASGVSLRSDPDEPVVHEDTVARSEGEALEGMTELIRRWEDSVADAPAQLLTLVRTGIVLDREAEVLKSLQAVVTLGAGGPLAGGKQWVPWIHVDDWLAIARAGLGLEEGVRLPGGPVIAAAPHPATNAEVMQVLRSHVAPAGVGLPTPKPLLTLGTRLLGKDSAMLTGGARAVSTVLPAAGFRFQHERIGEAVAELLR